MRVAGTEPARPGERLGAWRLIGCIGEGGMGEVWLAERVDGLFEARVAIKLLRHDLAGPGLQDRFARERALLARLQHPGIARLLDAGQDAGRPYLVLEHVAGAGLAEHVRAQRLNVAERVRLLLEIAGAVEQAHAQLILHRDLKPANVMVTPEGRTKLLDFGVATLLDDEGAAAESPLTRQVGRRVTLAYAAPEQLTGEAVGVAVDVHALGVMLFELLSGVLPYAAPAGGSRTALEHALLHTEPQRLSRTAPPAEDSGGPGRPPDFERARGDLEAVAAKAMRKRPAERYASVRALMDDLQCWLEHRPVSARRDHWRHRSRLWLRRNAAAAVAAVLIALGLGIGLAAALWQWQRAQAAAQQSERVTSYLGELLASGNPDEHGGRPPTVLQLLEKSRTELPQRFGDDPGTLVRLLEVLVSTYRDLNRYDIAIPLAQQRIAASERSFGAADGRSLEARMALAGIYTSQGSPDKVIALTEPLAARWVEAHGEVSPEHAHLLYLQGVAYARVGRLDEAEAVLMRARPIVDALYRPEEFEHLFFDNYVQGLRVAQGRLADAERLLLAMQPRWQQAAPAYARFVLVLRRNLLALRIRQARFDGIEAQGRALLADMEALLGPGNDMAAGLRQEMARLYADLGDDEGAAAMQRENEARLEAAGVSYAAQRLPVAAERLLADALAGRPDGTTAAALLAALRADRTLGGPGRLQVASAVARCALRLGDLALAAQALDLARSEPMLVTARALAGRIAQLDGQRLRAEGRWAESAQRLRARLAQIAAEPEPQPMPRWTAALDLAATLRAAGDPGAAAALAQADAWRPAALPPGHPRDAERRALDEMPAGARTLGLGRW